MTAMDPATITCLRGAILAGCRVLVETAGGLEPFAREAAVVAGREGELRVLHVGLAPQPPLRIRPDSRRNPDAIYGHDLMADILDVPVGDRDEFAAAGILIVITHGDAHAKDAFTAGLVRAFEEDGLPSVTRFRDTLGSPGSTALDFEATDPAWPGWAEVVADRMAGTVSGGDAVAAWIASPDRMAVALFGGRHMSVAYEIGPDGWCEAAGIQHPEHWTRSLAEIAAAVWRGGLALAAGNAAVPLGAKSRSPHSAAYLLHNAAPGAPLGESAVRTAAMAIARMDAPLVAALGSGSTAHALYRGIAAAGPARVARRDFVVTWPAFSEALLDPEVLREVDRGARTAPVIAGLVGITPAVARRLAGRTAMPACCHAFRSETVLTSRYRLGLGDLLSALGHDALPLPEDEAGWRAFLVCCKVLHGVLRRARLEDPDPTTCAGLLLAGGGDWPARRRQIDRFGSPDAGGAGDMVRAFSEFLTAAAVWPVGGNAALELLACEGSLGRLLAASRRYHADRRLVAGLGDIPDHVTWPVPFGTIDLGDGRSIVPLTNPRQLREEGAEGPDADGIEGLRHCVGGYASQCWSGESLVLSIRRTEGGRTTRLSTAELRPATDGPWRVGSRRYGLNQHSGRGNARPPREAIKAMGILQEELSRGGIPIDDAALRPRAGEPETGSPRERAEALHDAWRAVMPRGLAKLSLDELVAVAAPTTLDRGPDLAS